MGFENLKEIVDYAKEKEQEAADFYLEASEKEVFSGSREMLKDFAKQELKHKQMLEDIETKGVVESVQDYKFKWIKDIKRSNYVEDIEYHPGLGYKDMLLLAMKREENALKLYNDLQDRAEDQATKDFFKVLCQEEAKHKLSLETLYDDYMAEMGD